MCFCVRGTAQSSTTRRWSKGIKKRFHGKTGRTRHGQVNPVISLDVFLPWDVAAIPSHTEQLMWAHGVLHCRSSNQFAHAEWLWHIWGSPKPWRMCTGSTHAQPLFQEMALFFFSRPDGNLATPANATPAIPRCGGCGLFLPSPCPFSLYSTQAWACRALNVFS